jgi:hypothetical protein
MIRQFGQEEALAAIAAVSLGLVASDLIATTNHFWSTHQVIVLVEKVKHPRAVIISNSCPRPSKIPRPG